MPIRLLPRRGHLPSALSRLTSRRCASTTPRLPSGPARTRFAPSPTGYLHLGSLRTALFNYLLAKKTGGQFLLRIEDTDAKRTVGDAEQRLYEDLKWAGLEWDEGPVVGGSYGPYRQSERTHIYKEHAEKLLNTPHGYRCFCTVERLDELARRRQALGLPTDYDRQCESLPREESDDRAAKGESYVVRLRSPSSYPEFRDLVYGRIGKDKAGANAGITVKHGEIAYEDPVLLKSDGRPTYHLANVVDDHLMKITHVVRATEWISSTPKHLALYEAFGWAPPQYAHVGLLVDAAGRKLSKRNFDTDVRSYRNSGVLPETLVNFAALLGWSHGRRSDVMSLPDLVDEFQMKFTKGDTTVTLEKVWFLQKQHAQRAAQQQQQQQNPSFDAMVDACVDAVQNNGMVAETETGEDETQHRLRELGLREWVARLLAADAKNYETPAQFVERHALFFAEPVWAPAAGGTGARPPSPPPAPPFDDGTELGGSAKHAAELLLGGEHEALRARPPSAADGDHADAAYLDIAIRAAAAGAISGPERVHEMLRAFGAEGSLANVAPLNGAEKDAYKHVCRWIRYVLFMSRPGPNLGFAMALLGRVACARRLALFRGHVRC